MRNIQQGLTSQGGRNALIMCGLAILLVTGCAWDNKEMPTATAEAATAAPQNGTDQVGIFRMFEGFAVVADLPVQF